MVKITPTNFQNSLNVSTTSTPINHVDIEGAVAFSAKHAQIWAEGTDAQVSGLGGEHSAKGWAEIAQEAATSGGGGTGRAEWGYIDGIISNQTDLQTALNSKMDKAGGTFTGDVTLDSGVSLKTANGRLHEVNNKIVLGDGSNNGLYVNPNGQTAALINGNTVKNFITSYDVKSTYSATGMDPVNGTAVASALANMAPASTTVLGPVKVDGTTITAQADGTISAAFPSGTLTRNDLATLAWNFSSGNYILGKNTLPFESSSAYNFVWHFISPSGTSGNRFMFACIDTEGTGGGFDIAYNSSRKMYISQSGVNTSGWAFDAAISDALTASTEYWLKMQYDGTAYTYTTATDKNFTNIVSTVTNSSSVKIKNTTSKGKFGAAARSGQTGVFGDGKIFLSDCYLEFDGVKAFDGSKGFEDYSINGGPNVVTVLK